MTKQTAKQFVLERYPKMRQESHIERTGRTTRTYTLIRNNNEYMWFACGYTPRFAKLGKTPKPKLKKWRRGNEQTIRNSRKRS